MGALTNVQFFFERFDLNYLSHHLVLHSNHFCQQIELTCPARHHLCKKAILLNGELFIEELLLRTIQGDLAKWVKKSEFLLLLLFLHLFVVLITSLISFENGLTLFLKLFKQLAIAKI